MNKIKFGIAGLLLASSLAFGFNDVPKDSWASEAVDNLYNKGLLAPTLENSPTFNGDGVFSRYEIAAMLYKTLQYSQDKILEKASAEDVIALKALTAQFAPELQKMGAKVDEFEKMLTEAIKKSEAKLGRKITNLENRVKKVNITGDFEASQTIGLKQNNPGMEELEFDATLVITGKPNDIVDVKTRLKLDQASKDDTNVIIDGLEISGKTSNGKITAFRDSDKGVASFSNTLSGFDAAVVDPEQGVIAEGKYKLAGKKESDYVAMFYKTDSGDFYAVQNKTQFNTADNKITSHLRLSYSEKIRNYQYDSEIGAKTDDAKSIYSIDGQLMITKIKNVDLRFEAEYATRRSPQLQDLNSDAVEYLPMVDSIVGSRDALYLYGQAKLKGALGLTFTGGLYNSGEYFDITGLGDETKPVFAETALVKSEANKKALLGKVKYDVASKNIFTTELTYASYGANNKDYLPAEEIVWLNTWNVIKGNKLKLEYEYKVEKEEVLPEDATVAEQLSGSISGEDGIETHEFRTTFNLLGDTTQHVDFTLSDDKDKDDREDTDKYYKFYVDHSMNLTKNVFWKIAYSYQKNGLDVSDYQIWKKIDKKWQDRIEYKSFEERKTEEMATSFKISTEKAGTFNIGYYRRNEDKKGGYDPYGFEYKQNKDDKYTDHIFAVHEYEFGNWTLTYGGKLLTEKEAVEKTRMEKINGVLQEVIYYDMEDLKRSEGGEYEVLYAIGLEYDFKNDTTVNFSYGDPTITEDGTNFMLDQTSFADGEQDQFTVSFKSKF